MTIVRDASTTHPQSVHYSNGHGSGIARQISVMLKRHLISVRRKPATLLQLLLQPVAFVLFFTFVVGRSISADVVPRYREFLLPGIQAQAIVTTIVIVGTAISFDLENCIFIRFRSLPISNYSPLIARGLIALLYSMIGYVVIGLVGFLVGWRFNCSVADVALALGLVLTFGLGFMWLGMAVGLLMKTVEGIGTITFLITLPVIALSNAFAPTQPMPHALRVIAEWNPLSAASQALRELTTHAPPAPPSAQLPMHHPALFTLIYSITFTAVLAPMAVRAYVRRTSQ
ncbi:ABC transporter permease [Mycobacterium sp. TY814]|uniref:ABC transporter permease n=1 Tax=unclassified Mycobacterium TaxID=2642494 RepID=UPI00274223D2|nr:ABC transporter permease [Mycobacterium sp. TY814]MDP7720953.1 ABC transporter permease [Mycobacterium sp. TY814]